MRKILAYYGSGRGKTSAALGYGIREAAHGTDVMLIQFLKQKDDAVYDFISRLEPEIRFYRFQKSEELYEDLSPEQQAEEAANMKNGLNYAKKVITTGQCDVLILDEVLGLEDNHIISPEELLDLIYCGSDSTVKEVILTGRKLDPILLPKIQMAYEIKAHKGSDLLNAQES